MLSEKFFKDIHCEVIMAEFKAFEIKVYQNGRTLFKHWKGTDSTDVTNFDEVKSGTMTFNLKAIKEQLLSQTFNDPVDFYSSNTTQPYQHKQQPPPSARQNQSKNFNNSTHNQYQNHNSRDNYKHDYKQSQNFNTSHQSSTSSIGSSKYPPKQQFPTDKSRPPNPDRISQMPWDDFLCGQQTFNMSSAPKQAEKSNVGESKFDQASLPL